MTDAEIIKALECCLRSTIVHENCDQCPYKIYNNYCMDKMLSDIHALINRQRAEIDQFADIGKMYSEVRAEAIREFAKFLIDKSESGVISVSDLPDFVKEMVGEDNG